MDEVPAELMAEHTSFKKSLGNVNQLSDRFASSVAAFCGAPCPDPFSPALGKTHPLANTLKPEDIVRPTIGVKLPLAKRPSILAGESSVT